MPPTRHGQGRRALALTLVLVVAAGLWLSRADWLPMVTASDPYQATPAENFAVGAEGITLPEYDAVDGMTVEQVGAALDRVKRALEASHLDPRLLVDGDPSTALGLLAPDSADVVRARLDSADYGTTLVRLAPGAVLADTPRVSGRMTYGRVDWRGTPALEVVTNYVWAYALTNPASAEPHGVVVIHSETRWMFPLATDLLPSSRGMYLGPTSGYWHGMDCAAAARGLTAPAPEVDRAADPEFRDDDPLDAYFDSSRPVGVESGCRGR